MKQQERKHARKAHGEAPETEPQDLRDEELARETDDLLAEIECCLAETEDQLETEARKAAKAEWDENEKAYGKIPAPHYWHNRDVWVEKYRHLFTMKYDCCGNAAPIFEDVE